MQARIGKRLALEFLWCGRRVSIVSNDTAGRPRPHAELTGLSCSFCTLLVCDDDELAVVRRMAGAYLRRSCPPDVVVNDAGFAAYRLFEGTSAEEIQRLLAVNVPGACLVAREGAKR